MAKNTVRTNEDTERRTIHSICLGVMAEQIFKDLPKYLNRFRETALLVAGELGNRLWDLKTEVERRIAEFTGKPRNLSQSLTDDSL